jgi:CubicO group peptidase (beta-lactamase class C family)
MTETSGVGLLEGPCVGLAEYFATAPPIWSQPGDVYYWNVEQAALAGLELERAGGAPFADAVRARILDPLGMTSFTFDGTVAEAGDHADGHFPEGDGLRVQHPDASGIDCAWAAPSFNAYANISDMARFAAMLLHGGDGLLAPAQVDRILRGTGIYFNPVNHNGYGMLNATWPGALAAYQGGVSGGYTQDFLIFPDRDLAVVVLVNGGELPTPLAVSSVASLLWEPDLDLSYTPTPPGASTLDDYAGAYTDNFDRRVDVQHDAVAGTLSIDFDGDLYPLAPVDTDQFEVIVGGQTLTLRFWRDGTGTPAIISGAGPPFYR